MKLAAALTTIIAIFTFAATADAAFQSRHLNAVASIFAMRPVVVRCMEDDEKNSPDYYGAWGYVLSPTAKQRSEQVSADLCRIALNVNDEAVDPYDRALAVMVIVHESYHLRRWGGAGNEGMVECQAIRHWRVGARMLGASEQTIEELWPWALAAHYEEADIVNVWTGERPYRDDDCVIPALRGGDGG